MTSSQMNFIVNQEKLAGQASIAQDKESSSASGTVTLIVNNFGDEH